MLVLCSSSSFKDAERCQLELSMAAVTSSFAALIVQLSNSLLNGLEGSGRGMSLSSFLHGLKHFHNAVLFKFIFSERNFLWVKEKN